MESFLIGIASLALLALSVFLFTATALVAIIIADKLWGQK